jgi:D-alanine-D-alanine ligase
MRHAFLYDDKLLIEQYVKGREIEVSVLGNERPRASVPGEIIPNHEFYSYRAKYIDPEGATLAVPAKLTKAQVSAVQRMALKAYKVLCLEGMARVDMFLTSHGPVLSEVNTIPGFTNISMYPKLWEASGLPYPKLLDELIVLALAKHSRKKRLKTNFTL